jgi:hypothetical protein
VFWAFINVSLHTLWWETCDIHFGWRNFSIESVDINKIMVAFYHLLVCPWSSVEKIILTQMAAEVT